MSWIYKKTNTMNISDHIAQFIRNADNKALATQGPHGINVVPVSTIFVEGNTIILVNYFLKKTLENIRTNPSIALVCWKGMDGYQIKGTVQYETSGELYNTTTEWVSHNIPGRVVKGVLRITPEQIFSVAP